MNEEHIISRADRILVTGSNGFVGVKVVETLLQNGYSNVRRAASRQQTRRLRRDRSGAGKFSVSNQIKEEVFKSDSLL